MAKRQAKITYARKPGGGAGKVAERYPDVGAQAQLRKKKPPKTYRYDSSLSPPLAWDGQNGAPEPGEWLVAQIEQASKLEAPHEFQAQAAR